MAGRKKGAGTRRGRKGNRNQAGAEAGAGDNAEATGTEETDRAARRRAVIDKIAAEVDAEIAAEGTGAETGGEEGQLLGSGSYLNDELRGLADEASGGQGQASSDDSGTASAPQPAVSIDNGQMAVVIGTAVGIGGNIVCQKLAVPPLDGDEVSALTTAFVGVLDAFGGLVFMDPKTAAVVNLGIVASAIVIRRLNVKGGEGDAATQAG